MTGCEDDNPKPPPPDGEEVEAFEVGGAAGPSLDNFIIDVAGHPSSKWNKAIIKIFINHFNKSPDHQWKEKRYKEHIEKWAKDHIRYLCLKFGHEGGKIGRNISPKECLRIAA